MCYCTFLESCLLSCKAILLVLLFRLNISFTGHDYCACGQNRTGQKAQQVHTHRGFGTARDLNFLYVTFSILECEHASFGQVGGGNLSENVLEWVQVILLNLFFFLRLDCYMPPPLCYVITKEASTKFEWLIVTGLAQKLESLDTIRDMTRKNSDSDEVESLGSMRWVYLVNWKTKNVSRVTFLTHFHFNFNSFCLFRLKLLAHRDLFSRRWARRINDTFTVPTVTDITTNNSSLKSLRGVNKN